MLFCKKYNILVIGSNGMLGHDVVTELRRISSSKDSFVQTVVGIDVEDDVDVADVNSLRKYFRKSIYFDFVINCVAYTNTSAAENTADGKYSDYRLNALASECIAQACFEFKSKLVHISTDYVFSEKSVPDFLCEDTSSRIPTRMLRPSDTPFPVNVYGMHKLLGEKNIQLVFAKRPHDYVILRTSWIYSTHNNKSFIHKFVKNLVKTAVAGKTEIEMTSNEISVPTSCEFVVQCIVDVIMQRMHGIMHAVPAVACDSTSGHVGVSRLEFAEQILAAYDPNTELSPGVKIFDMKLEPVERDSYWPSYSAMLTSFESGCWEICLNRFMSKHGIEILEWAKTQK